MLLSQHDVQAGHIFIYGSHIVIQLILGLVHLWVTVYLLLPTQNPTLKEYGCVFSLVADSDGPVEAEGENTWGDAVCGFYFSYCYVCVCFVLCIGSDGWLEWMSGARGLSIEETDCVCSVPVHLCSWSSVACYSLILELAVFLVFPAEFFPSKGFFLRLVFPWVMWAISLNVPFSHCPPLRLYPCCYLLFCHSSL